MDVETLKTLWENFKWMFDGGGIAILERLIPKSKESDRLIINTGDINIENINISIGGNNPVLNDYKILINWLKNKGKSIFIEKLGNEFAQSFVSYVDSIPSEISPNIIELSNVVNKVGELEIFENEFIDETLSFKRLIKQLTNPEKRLKDILAYNVGREFIKQKNERLREIDENKLEKNNIGGIVFFLQTNIVFSNQEILTPELLGFEIVEDENALVNLALKNKVLITKIKLISGSQSTDHKVRIRIKNLTNDTISFNISKGQVFENKHFEDDLQNLVVSKGDIYTLKPNQKREFTINAYCLNRDKGIPEGLDGNIAIYQVKDRSFVDGSELWDKMKEIKEKIFAKE